MKLTKTMLFLASVTAFVVAGSTAALADTSAGANLNVSATVVKQCVINTANLSFGNYLFTAATDSSATMTLNCTLGTSPKVKLNTGSYAAGNQRNMKIAGTGTDLLKYDLYSDSARTTTWATDGVGILASDTSVTIYGRIPTLQYVPAGNYGDTVVATIDF